MSGATATSQRRLQHALEALAGRLDGASIKRSAIEAVLGAHGGTPDLREQVDGALRAAQILVVEDEAVVLPAVPAASDPEASAAPSDVLAVARARLAADRSLLRHRLAKIILSAEEEVGLTLLARPDAEPLPSGGFSSLTGEAREAAEAMLLHNMGLIHSVAQRLGGQGLEYDDLVASGVPGLVRAIELFDPHRGLKFSTYAMHWVRQSIGRAIDDEGRLIRLPVHVCESVRQVRAAQERLTVNGRLPRSDEIARELRIPERKVQELLRLAPAVLSLDHPVGNDGITLGDLLDRPVFKPDPVLVGGLDADDLKRLLNLLGEREADVLRRRHGIHPYGDPQTLEEIGRVYGVTRERIRQVEHKAMTKLKVHLGLEVPEPRRKKKASAEHEPADVA